MIEIISTSTELSVFGEFNLNSNTEGECELKTTFDSADPGAVNDFF